MYVMDNRDQYVITTNDDNSNIYSMGLFKIYFDIWVVQHVRNFDNPQTIILFSLFRHRYGLNELFSLDIRFLWS